MKVLITGAGGFVARYLADELQAHGHAVSSTDILPSVDMPDYHQADLCDRNAMRTLVRMVAPDACVHLGAISFVPDGDKDPSKLLAINIGGTVNLLSAFDQEAPGSRFLFVSTAQVYGCSPEKRTDPVTTDSPIYPLSMYTISKCAGEKAALAYAMYRKVDAMVVRPGNHTGPGQVPKFLIPSLVLQAKKIRNGDASRFVAGNLDSERDFTDVRDIISAYRLILEKGTAGKTYNVSSGNHVPLKNLLAMIQAKAGINAQVEVDPSLVRPTDYSRIMDTSDVRDELGWQPMYSLEQTINDMINA